MKQKIAAVGICAVLAVFALIGVGNALGWFEQHSITGTVTSDEAHTAWTAVSHHPNDKPSYFDGCWWEGQWPDTYVVCTWGANHSTIDIVEGEVVITITDAYPGAWAEYTATIKNEGTAPVRLVRVGGNTTGIITTAPSFRGVLQPQESHTGVIRIECTEALAMGAQTSFAMLVMVEPPPPPPPPRPNPWYP